MKNKSQSYWSHVRTVILQLSGKITRIRVIWLLVIFLTLSVFFLIPSFFLESLIEMLEKIWHSPLIQGIKVTDLFMLSVMTGGLAISRRQKEIQVQQAHILVEQHQIQKGRLYPFVIRYRKQGDLRVEIHNESDCTCGISGISYHFAEEDNLEMRDIDECGTGGAKQEPYDVATWDKEEWVQNGKKTVEYRFAVILRRNTMFGFTMRKLGKADPSWDNVRIWIRFQLASGEKEALITNERIEWL
ncbi:MAG: hypothetical protein K0R63_706 [Rickettsiales bacterium]|jgi:hypothetical protein|nr:hypothetical protein [Rickettsiales bacterium]